MRKTLVATSCLKGFSCGVIEKSEKGRYDLKIDIMLQNFFHRILLRRHFWRYATFSEIAELYTARMLRMTGNTMVAALAAIYLFKSGYSLQFIAAYYVLYFAFKTLTSWPSAAYVARFGPKHGMLAANIVGVPALIAFSFLDSAGLWALSVYSVCQAISMTLYNIAHLVDFSKVKNDLHAGKELGYMNIIDKVAAGASPLLGGMLAWLISPEVAMWVAAGLLLLAAVPLFRTAEPMKVRQKLDYDGFPWRSTWRSVRGQAAIGVDVTTTAVFWPLFMAAVLFASSSDEVYAQIGGITAITVIVGLFVSRAYGVLIDRNQGGVLLRYTTVAKGVVHAVRSWVATPFSAVLVNVFNETATAGYNMSYMRGMFDLADRTGHRVVYLLCTEVSMNLGSLLISVIAYCSFALVSSVRDGFMVLFVASGLGVLLMLGSRYPLYRKSSKR